MTAKKKKRTEEGGRVLAVWNTKGGRSKLNKIKVSMVNLYQNSCINIKFRIKASNTPLEIFIPFKSFLLIQKFPGPRALRYLVTVIFLQDGNQTLLW